MREKGEREKEREREEREGEGEGEHCSDADEVAIARRLQADKRACTRVCANKRSDSRIEKAGYRGEIQDSLQSARLHQTVENFEASDC